jgi:hypothetical protein
MPEENDSPVKRVSPDVQILRGGLRNRRFRGGTAGSEPQPVSAENRGVSDGTSLARCWP